MTLQNKYDNIKIPDRLDSVIEKGLKEGIAIRKKQSRRKRVYKYGSVAAAILITISIFATNPVWASKLSFIEKIFIQVQNQITFSGDYASRSEMININSSRKEKLSGNSAADKGVKMDISDVVCDGVSVYLTFNINVEKSFGKIAKYCTTSSGEKATAFTYIEGNWSAGNDGKKYKLDNVHIEGNQIDEHNFVGVAKIDISHIKDLKNKFDFCLNLNNLAADQITDKPNDSMIPSYYKVGTWNFIIPIKPDSSLVKTVAVNEVNKNGIGIVDATLTPYEFQVNVSEKTMINDYGVAAFTQDGKRLQWEKQSGNTLIFAVQEKKVSSIDLFVNKDFIQTVKCTDKSLLEKSSVIHKIIQFN